MKTRKLSIKSSIAWVIIATVLSLPLTVYAEEAENSASDVSASAGSQENKDHETPNAKPDARKQIVKEAADAARATQAALKALESNQPKEALAALEVVSGNLHLLLARDSGLGLIPIDTKIQIIEGMDDLEMIKQLEDELDDLVDDKHYQAARPIIDSLVDEMRVTIVYLPLAIYPAAIDQVAPLIDAGKMDEAKMALKEVLNTFVSEQEVTPLSIIRADEKLTEAFQIEHKEDLSKQETKNKIAKLVSEVNHEIKIAEALGYGSKSDYAPLYGGMEALKKAIGTAGFKGEWIKIKKSISAFKNRVVHSRG